jgi:two-component system, OmpR family, phosphate regulon sensor histidine kinase PhoR
VRGKIRLRLLLGVWAVVTASVYITGLILAAPPAGSLFVAALIVGAASGALISEMSVRWFDQTVRPVTDAARRMHQGDMSVRARVGREDDVGQLGAAFDQLAGSLSRTVGELRDERDLVSHILDGMQEGVLLLDKEGKVALMNPALREMLLLRADVIGQPLLEVVRHAELKEILDRARTTKTTCSGEVELSGLKPRRLLVRGTAFTQHAGGLLAVFFDVTDIRRLESLRRDFVANVSHELRTPVTAVLSAAETLDMALDKDPEGARRFLGIIERNAARLRGLIEDLLDLSRIESRELKLRPERFDFEPFASHLVGLFRDRADKKRIAIRLDCPKKIDVDCDRRALEQVLTNLVDNAVKYCPEGCTVVLRAERLGEARELGGVNGARETSRSLEPATRLCVVDDGPGIEEKHIGRLFERFYRVDAGRSREMGGTGLGLSICKHLVEAMGGSIEVTSKVGKGTTFEVRIPDGSARMRDRSSASVVEDDEPSQPRSLAPATRRNEPIGAGL